MEEFLNEFRWKYDDVVASMNAEEFRGEVGLLTSIRDDYFRFDDKGVSILRVMYDVIVDNALYRIMEGTLDVVKSEF